MLISVISQSLSANEKPGIKTKVIGKGQPVILIPGFTCDGTVWDGTIEAMGKGYQFHVMTLPGFAGNAPLENPEAGFFAQVQTMVLDYIDENKIKKPIIVGHSLGGFMAIKIAAENPGLLRKIVAVDALPFLPAIRNPSMTSEEAKISAKAYRINMENAFKLPLEQKTASQKTLLKWMIKSPEHINIATQWYLDSDEHTMSQAMFEMNTLDLREEIAKIKAPTLVLGAWLAGKDYGATRAGVLNSYKDQYAKLKGVQVDMSDKGNHFIMWDDPEFLNEWLKKFL